jgi:1,2-diacylglycerol 3-alpha-glucosyltransferase
MNILILNSILYTAQNNVIPQVDSIKDTMIYNLALGFKELGHHATLIAASEYKPLNEEEYDVDVIFIKSKFGKIFPPTVLPFQPGIRHFLRKNRETFDLIISSEVFAFPSLFAAIICPRKTIIWHELALHQRKMKSIPSCFWYNVIAKLFFRKTFIVPRSESAKGFISKYLANVSDYPVEHGINLKKFRYSAEKKDRFIVVAQLIPRKNIAAIIRKFGKLIADEGYINFKLLIVGKGELECELKALVAQMNMEENVEFSGFKPHSELNLLIAESMAMLIDTKQDNNMVSIPESIVSGTPVVTNAVPTNAPLIHEYQLGIVEDGWDENTLMNVIQSNASYVNNCIHYRSQLSATYTAQKLIDGFISKK